MYYTTISSAGRGVFDQRIGLAESGAPRLNDGIIGHARSADMVHWVLESKAQSAMFCTWSVPGDSLTGPWDISMAMPFEAEPDLFAAPFIQDRSVRGPWSVL